jgi:hypothetical protein
MRTVNYGGDLKIGDFIAVSYNSGFILGWYCGEGKNTLQFFETHWPSRSLDQYNRVKADAGYRDHDKANSEEFNKSWITKSYVMHWKWRVMKIQDPESLFTDIEDLNKYIESRQILEQIKSI